jgi:DNA-binding transcriptional regulator YdaS (Cro superfamily)
MTLARAAQLVGGRAKLADLLCVSQSTLGRWMSGRSQMPIGVFLSLVELTRKAERQH